MSIQHRCSAASPGVVGVVGVKLAPAGLLQRVAPRGGGSGRHVVGDLAQYLRDEWKAGAGDTSTSGESSVPNRCRQSGSLTKCTLSSRTNCRAPGRNGRCAPARTAARPQPRCGCASLQIQQQSGCHQGTAVEALHVQRSSSGSGSSNQSQHAWVRWSKCNAQTPATCRQDVNNGTAQQQGRVSGVPHAALPQQDDLRGQRCNQSAADWLPCQEKQRQCTQHTRPASYCMHSCPATAQLSSSCLPLTSRRSQSAAQRSSSCDSWATCGGRERRRHEHA